MPSLRQGGQPSSLIKFQKSFNSSIKRTYTPPWETTLFECYNSTVKYWRVVFVDFFANSATLSKSGTKCATFVRVWFGNIRKMVRRWNRTHTKHFPLYLPDSQKRRLKALLYHRFILQLAENLIRALYTGHVVSGQTLVPRIGMCIADKPEERMLFSFKGHDNFMD